MEQTGTHAENRTLLLERALQLFTARGYDAVGVQEVAEAAGVTKPTLYHYFHSKQGQLQALLKEHFRSLEDALRGAADYRGDLSGALGRVASRLRAPAHLYPLHCLLFTMPGVPSIYYGSEWGIPAGITRDGASLRVELPPRGGRIIAPRDRAAEPARVP